MMWMRSAEYTSRPQTRIECQDIKRATARSHSNMSPRAYGWIEFPAWALTIPKMADTIDAASRSAKEYEQYGGLIRVSDIVTNGHFPALEATFQKTSVPYDCGGETPGSRISWNGWWRMGFRHPVQYEVSSIGEQFIPLEEVRTLLRLHEKNTPLFAALEELVRKSDNSAPTALRDTDLPPL